MSEKSINSIDIKDVFIYNNVCDEEDQSNNYDTLSTLFVGNSIKIDNLIIQNNSFCNLVVF